MPGRKPSKIGGHMLQLHWTLDTIADSMWFVFTHGLIPIGIFSNAKSLLNADEAAATRFVWFGIAAWIGWQWIEVPNLIDRFWERSSRYSRMAGSDKSKELLIIPLLILSAICATTFFLTDWGPYITAGVVFVVGTALVREHIRRTPE